MPTCICPQCSKSHKIPAKNLGLKGRCTQCRSIFDLIEQPAAPELTPAPVFVPPLPDEEDTIQNFEAETFSLKQPEPPVPAAATDSPGEWDLDEDEFNETPQKPKGRGEVAPLRRRPALSIIATTYTVVGLLFLLIALVAFAVGVVALFRGSTPQLAARAAALVATLIPVFVGSIMTAVFCIACGEVIRWGIAVEQRLHEISKNLTR